MLVHDELLGITLRELPDGKFERVQPEAPPPSPPPPIHTVDTSLPDWFEETRQEAIKARYGAKEGLTFAERTARDAWRAHIADRRQTILAKLAATEVPAGHALQLIRADGPCGGGGRRLLQFSREIMQWLVDTSDPILHEAMVSFDNQADVLEGNLRSVNGASRSSSPDTLEKLAIVRTKTIRTHLARGEIKATRNAAHHCHTAMVRHTTHDDAQAHLKAICSCIAANGETIAAASWWEYVAADGTHMPTRASYEDYVAGRDVPPWLRERFEASWRARSAWDGLWPHEKPPAVL